MKKFLSSFILVLVTGCGAVSNDDNSTPTPTPTPGLTIADIQQGEVAPESSVTLEGVIVTAVDPFNDNIDFYAQDPGGGEYSGMYFFDGDAVVPAALEVGDEVTVEGTYTEYQGPTGDPWNETISEIRVTSATITDTGLTPTATTIAAADLGEELTGNASEPWEFVFIEIDGAVNVLSASLGFGEFSVGNGQATEQIRVDDQLYSDAELGRYANETITHLAGIWSYSFDEYKLEPRDATDLVGDSGAPVAATVVMVQDTMAVGHPSIGQNVSLTSVVVTAAWTSSGERKFFVSDATTQAPWTGVQIFNQNAGNTLVPLSVTTGNVLSFVGQYDEFDGSVSTAYPGTAAQLVLNSNSQHFSFTVVNATPAAITPLDVTFTELTSNPEQYEGSLVRITTMTTCTASTIGNGEYTIWAGGAYPRLVVDDQIWFNAEVGMTVGRSFPTYTGIFHQAFGNHRILPRSPNDVP